VALRTLQAQTPKQRAQAVAVSTAFQAWRYGNHPGELMVLEKTPEFLELDAFRGKYPENRPVPAPPAPQVTAPSSLKSIGVGLYSLTNANANFARSLSARMADLRAKLLQFNNWLLGKDANLRQLDNPFQGIFLAPEYYFTKPNAAGQRQFLSATEKSQIEAGLKQLSASFPTILIVPGTIHYDVQLSGQAKVEAGYQLLQAAKQRIVRQNALATPKTVLDASMSRNATGPLSKVASINEMADSLLKKDMTPYKVHNLTYLLLDGKVLAQYDKHADFYEAKSSSPDQSMFIPGTQDECPEVGNARRTFRFGVEICFDHANGVLKRRAPANLHFHIVVSDYVTTMTGNMAMRNGGYFLHASTNHAHTVVYRRGENGALENLTTTAAKENLLTGQEILDVYLVKLPPPAPPPVPPMLRVAPVVPVTV
jgi:predicted amidohydrolase